MGGSDEQMVEVPPRFTIDIEEIEKFHVHGEIFIDMDQTSELVKLDYLLRLVNLSVTENPSFNFSHSMALGLIREYMNQMYTLASPTTIALVCLYIPVFIISLVGNGLVIFVVFSNPHMRRVKNMFLVNLAFSDLLITLLCMPMVVGQIIFRLWVYGDLMCRLSGYMQGVAVTSSIFTLTALSIDRYLAIKTPLHHSRRVISHCHAFCFLILIWTLAGLFICPLPFVRSVYEVHFDSFHISMNYCIEEWDREGDRRAFAVFLLIVTYILPFLIISSCYVMIGRTLCSDEFHRKTSDSSSTVMLGRKRVARMMIVLIGVFMISWLPYNICSLNFDINPKYTNVHVLPFSLWFGHAHSAVNPVLYWYLNKSFRYCMQKALRCETLRRSQRDTPSPHPGAIGEILRFDFRRRPDAIGRDAEEPVSVNRRPMSIPRDHLLQYPRNAHNYDRRPRSEPGSSSSSSNQRGPTIDKQQSGRVVRIIFNTTPSSSRLPSTVTSRMRSGLVLGGESPSPAKTILNDDYNFRGRRQSLPVRVEHVLSKQKEKDSLQDDFV